MSWDLSPDAAKVDAAAWFKARVPASPSEMLSIEENSKRQAFWMGGVMTKQRAAKVKRSLADALERGIDFDTWRRENRNILARIPRSHLETTFRNWTQTAYNSARIDYLSNPAVVKRRPYWIFDAVLDGRTTRVCTAYDGTVLPAKHRWFLEHTPPLHHNCRSTIRGLTKRQGEKAGIRQRAPSDRLTKKQVEKTGTELEPGVARPEAGFGTAIVKPWQPKGKKRPPMRKARPKKVNTPDRVKLKDIKRAKMPPRPKYEPEASPSLPADQREAVGEYSLTNYSETRDVQRLSKELWLKKYPKMSATDYQEMSRRADLVSKAIEENTGKRRKVYRGIEVDRDTAERLAAVKRFRTDTITSTSKLPSIAEDFAREFPDDEYLGVIFEIEGSGFDIGDVSFNENEREVLLGAGKSFDVKSVGRLKTGQLLIKMVEVPGTGGAALSAIEAAFEVKA